MKLESMAGRSSKAQAIGSLRLAYEVLSSQQKRPHVQKHSMLTKGAEQEMNWEAE